MARLLHAALLLLFCNLASSAVPGTVTLDHFQWGVLEPSLAGQSFVASLVAYDSSGGIVSNYHETVSFSAWSTNTMLGNEQPAFASSEQIDWSLGNAFRPATDLLVTHVRHYSGTNVSIWAEDGSLLSSVQVTGPPETWTETPLPTPLHLTAGNRYIVSFLTDVTNYYSRLISQQTNPVPFLHGTIEGTYRLATATNACPTESTPSVAWWLVDLRYVVPVPMAPAAGTFTNGLWAGQITISNPCPNVVLWAQDELGFGGASSSFQVSLPSPRLRPLLKGNQVLMLGGMFGAVEGVAVAGDYAYVAQRTRLEIVDLKDLTNCAWMGGYATPGSANGVTVVGPYAYVADGGAGLQIIDVSAPTNCTWVGGAVPPGNGDARGVVVLNNRAYLADGPAGLQVIDVSEPTNCVWMGRYVAPGIVRGLAVVEHRAYLAAGSAGLQVIDVSEPTNCVWLGAYDTAGTAVGVAVAGHYAYVADGTNGLEVIDVRNPAQCVRVGGYDTGGYAYGVAVAGQCAYVADGTNGLAVIDVSNPGNCVRLGEYERRGADARGVAVTAKGIYVANMGGGMKILFSLPNVQNMIQVRAGFADLPCVIEAASSLNPPVQWRPVFTNASPAFPFDFTDFDVRIAQHPEKYYRVRQP